MTLPARVRSVVLGAAMAVGALAAAVALPGCSPQTQFESASTDQEITREIKLKMRDHPRFQDIQVVCVNRVITLRGRVDNLKIAQEAARICKSCSASSQILMRLDIRPR